MADIAYISTFSPVFYWPTDSWPDKFWPSSQSELLVWQFKVDWDGDGTCESDEAWLMTDFTLKRGRDFYMAFDGTGFERVGEGNARAVFDNFDGRFDPYNTSSDLYPYVGPGKLVEIAVQNGVGGTTYPLMIGKIADVRPFSGEDKRVTITVVDLMRQLKDQKVNIAVQAGQRVDAIFASALTAASWPAGYGSTIDSDSSIIPYWWARDVVAYDVLNQLAEAALGVFFIAADGKAKYYSRSHTASPVAELDQTEIKREISLPQPWDTIRNTITVKAKPLVAVATTELWRLQETTAVSAGASVTFWAPYTYGSQEVPAINVITPQATTDYTANTEEAGTGTDLTTDFSVVKTDYGTVAKLVFTNGSASDGYLTLAKLRGDALYCPNEVLIVGENTSSITAYGPRQFSMESQFIQDTNLATSYKDYLKTSLANIRMFPTIQLEARQDVQFGIDLFDRVGLQIDALGISNSLAVGSIEHRWLISNGQAVLTTLILEPVPPASTSWTFPTQIGTTSIFGF